MAIDHIFLTQSLGTSIDKELEQDPRLQSHHTKRQYKSALSTFETWRDGRPMTKTLVNAYVTHLQSQGLAPRTINQKLAAIRWLARKIGDLIQNTQWMDIALSFMITKQVALVASVPDVKGNQQQSRRYINPGELDALLQVCKVDTSMVGVRDATLFALAWAAGLSREELTTLTTQDLKWDKSGEVVDITIRGKGNKTRTVYINNGAVKVLFDWLAIRGNIPGSLFCKISKGGKFTYERLSGEAVRLILEKRCKEAKISKPITWRDFRRTFAGNLFQAGIGGMTIQKLMGHLSLKQTGEYDQRSEETRLQNVKSLNVPYKTKKWLQGDIFNIGLNKNENNKKK